ncbi:GspH/FimT family pseudopilin [Lyngbya confervoides]|uniref:Prepilin-type N-terminal cleavage/methylation domain-containing protein n=1 Tax=Lyngbya confervoides BDU141951 TaxID=1574623 RepID=A0ABD4T3X3_9CYAN|nr:GspH/FimT family pseudopilin [Lyngbya confervoides]MCM1983279.1 prepilin-type N-terminal cleavage/methylation domain-containing protein [Lyngbya confervoides BDU141951]
MLPFSVPEHRSRSPFSVPGRRDCGWVPARGLDPDQGFTLTEMAVIVVVVGVLAAMASPSLRHHLNQVRLEGALLSLQGALREAQNEAIRRSQTCTVTVNPGVDSTITGSCLITGDRRLKEVELRHNRSSGPWHISFDYKGRNRDPANSGTIVLSVPNSRVRPLCLVMSVGIGLRRTGEYQGRLDSPLASDCLSS